MPDPSILSLLWNQSIEQAKNISYLRAYGQQHGEQSIADAQSEPCEQMESPQLILYTHTTSYDAKITEKTPMTSDIQSGQWEQMGSPRLKLNTKRPTTSYNANITVVTPMTSDVQSGPWEQIESTRLELDTNSLTTSYDAYITKETQMTSYV